MDPDHKAEGTAAVIEAAQQANTLQSIKREGEYYAVVGPDGSAHLLDTEKLLDAPLRPRGTFHPATVGSFISYVEKHDQGDGTTVWVHECDGKVVAVLNDHSPEIPAWRDHRAVV